MTKLVMDTPSDRAVLGSRHRALHRKLCKYLSTGDVDKLLAGQRIEPQINDPKAAKALTALMPEVAAYVRSGRG